MPGRYRDHRRDAHILRAAVREGPKRTTNLGSRIAKRVRRAGLTADLPEWRGRVRAADFDA